MYFTVTILTVDEVPVTPLARYVGTPSQNSTDRRCRAAPPGSDVLREHPPDRRTGGPHGETLARAGPALPDRLHDHPGRVDRAGRRAVDRAGADLLVRWRPVGPQRLRADVRRPAPARRAGVRPVGPQAGADGRTGRLRRL